MKPKILTTKLSTRGQVVIPKELREDLDEGTPFIVKRGKDVIILKKIDIKPDWDRIEKNFERVGKIVRKSGIKPEDIPAIVKRIREEIRKENEGNLTTFLLSLSLPR